MEWKLIIYYKRETAAHLPFNILHGGCQKVNRERIQKTGIPIIINQLTFKNWEFLRFLANQYEMEPKETIGELTSDIKYVTRIEKARKGGSGLLFIGLLDPEHLSFSFH